MKRKDLMLIGFVALIGSAISFFVSNSLISPPSDRRQSVEIAPAIDTDFQRPPSDYFNQESVNPTQTIEIGDDQNDQPFTTE